VSGGRPDPDRAAAAPRVAVAYHSGYGHTEVLADAVRAGAQESGALVRTVAVESMTDADWEFLDAADGIVFGTPTYMGAAAAAFQAFAEATSPRWSRRAWDGKAAAGFTVSGAKSGDKLNTLQALSVLAAQHGMVWVSLGLLPGWNSSTASEHDLNRLGFYLGVGAQANVDEGAEAVTKADAETARHLGARIASVAAALAAARG
jgi:multimeric flavodoxin WrbA